MTEPHLIDLQFRACPSELGAIRAEVRRVTREQGCSDELSAKLVLVLDEAITNVIRHAYRGNREGAIRLQMQREDQQLIFRLRDFAGTVDATCIKPRDLSECRPGGLGINFIDSVMDHWEFCCPEDGPGNVLIMTRQIDSGASGSKSARSSREL